jgi:glycosyltransferase involved in cell wall biosynthesis
MLSVSIIIPTKNEEQNVKQLIKGIWDALVPYKLELKYEIIVVDDSDDNTALIAQSLGVKVIKGRGLGLAQAVLDGIDQTQSNAIIVMDADLQHPPSKLPELIKQLKYHDLVVMTKHTKESMADLNFYRKLLSNLGTWASHVLIPAPVSDPMTGFFGIRRKCLDGIPRGEYIQLDTDKIIKEVAILKENYPEDWDKLDDKLQNEWYLQNGYATKMIGIEAIGFKIGLELFTKAKWVTHTEIPISFAKRVSGQSKGVSNSLQKHLWRLFKNSLSCEIELPLGSEEYHNFYEGNDWHKKWKQDISKLIHKISNQYKPEKVLDVGCGSSPNINFFYGKCVGIDIHDKALEFMKDYSDAKFEHGSVLDIPFSDKSFDMVGCIEVIEHLTMQDCRKAVSELSRVVKDGGHIILATPNYGSILWNVIENVQHIFQPKAWTKDHITHFNRKSISKLCAEYGLQEIRYDGIQANMDMVITYKKVGQ